VGRGQLIKGGSAGAAWTFFALGVGGLLASCMLIVGWLRYTGLVQRSHHQD
jgi:hypothetical protein